MCVLASEGYKCWLVPCSSDTQMLFVTVNAVLCYPVENIDFFILFLPASLRYKSPKTWRGAEGEGWPGSPNPALKGAP